MVDIDDRRRKDELYMLDEANKLANRVWGNPNSKQCLNITNSTSDLDDSSEHIESADLPIKKLQHVQSPYAW